LLVVVVVLKVFVLDMRALILWGFAGKISKRMYMYKNLRITVWRCPPANPFFLMREFLFNTDLPLSLYVFC